MIDLFAVYECPKCGDVLEDKVFLHEDIDIEKDRIYQAMLCEQCFSEVRAKLVGGDFCFEKVDHDRWLWANGYYDHLFEDMA